MLKGSKLKIVTLEYVPAPILAILQTEKSHIQYQHQKSSVLVFPENLNVSDTISCSWNQSLWCQQCWRSLYFTATESLVFVKASPPIRCFLDFKEVLN